MKKSTNEIQSPECFGSVHAKVFEIILIIGFVSSLILLTVCFVLTMWFFKYSTYIFAIEIVLLGLNFLAVIFAIILRVWRSDGSASGTNNSAAFCVSIMIIIIIIISLLGSIACDILVSYIINFKYLYVFEIINTKNIWDDDEDSNSRRNLEMDISSSSLVFSEQLSGSEIVFDSSTIDISIDTILPAISDLSNSIDSTVVNELSQESNIPIETDTSINTQKQDDDDDLQELLNDLGIKELPDENLFKIFGKIFNKCDKYFEDTMENAHDDDDFDLEKIEKKENFAQLFSYISMSYNGLIQCVCLINLIFIIKRIKSRSDFGSGMQSQIGVSSFQNMLGNNRKSKLSKKKR